MPRPVPLDSATLQRLRDRIRGPVLTPGEPGYDEARRVWNGRFDRRPGAVARCTGAADVMAAVDVARERQLLLSVKSGGHSYAGHGACDAGLTLDLSLMRGVRIDPRARRARVQAATTWGAFDHEAQAFGLGTTGGTVSTVGVAGFTLGGGTGHLARSHGLALDNLVSVDIVTADGTLICASQSDSPDLFWALRGGGGNFGIVTSFEFALHEVGPTVVAGQIIYPLEQAGDVLRAYREFMAEAPDEVNGYAVILRVPPVAGFPEEFHGQMAIDLFVVHTGGGPDAEQVFAPLRGLGRPILDAIGRHPYVEVQRMLDAGVPKGQRWHTRAHYLDDIPDAAIDAVVHHGAAMPGAFTMAYFEPLGAAIGRVDPSATAFPHRRAAFGFHILAGWIDPEEDQRVVAWTDAFHDAMSPFSTGGVYVNLLGADEAARVPSAYGPNYGRLVDLKQRYDPRNLFRVNHNISLGA